MANQQHLDLILQGGKVWNRWRETAAVKKPDLSRANLEQADLRNIDLSGVNLDGANLRAAKLHWANLKRANLRKADLKGAMLQETTLHSANLSWTNLQDACLRHAYIQKADLSWANLKGANLREADLRETDLREADLREADLREADFRKADLREAYLSNADLRNTLFEGADLRDADLRGAHLFKTNLKHARLSGCHIYGMSAWEIVTDKTTEQMNLVFTDWDEPLASVDNLYIAQLLDLLLHHQAILDVFQMVSSRFALILGRFSPERKSTLDAIRDALRHDNYAPILLDFQKPDYRDFKGLVATLAKIVKFVIVDFTEPKQILPAAMHIVRTTNLPVQPILAEDADSVPVAFQKQSARILETWQYRSAEEIQKIFTERIFPQIEAQRYV